MGKMLHDRLKSVHNFSNENLLSKVANDPYNLVNNGVLTGDNSGKASNWSFAVASGTVTFNIFSI